MNTQPNTKNDDLDLDLNYLLTTLIKGKFIIISFAIVALILSSLYTFVVLSPVYESKALLVVNLTESVTLPFGSFRIPLTTVDEFSAGVFGGETLRLTERELNSSFTKTQIRNRLRVERIPNSTSFWIIAQGGSPEDAYNLASLHVNSYLLHVEKNLLRLSTQNFINSAVSRIRLIERGLERNEDDIAKSTELLSSTPSKIDIVNALISNAEFSLIYSSVGQIDLVDIKRDKIISQVLNPAYLKIMDHVIDLELERSLLLVQLEQAQRDISVLERELEALKAFSDNLSTDHLTLGLSDPLKNIVQLVYRPYINEIRVSPRNKVNIAIGTFLGVFSGIFAVFVKRFLDTEL